MKLPCNLEISSWHTFVDILPQLPGEQALLALTVWAPPNVPILLTLTAVRDCSLRTQHTKAPPGMEPGEPWVQTEETKQHMETVYLTTGGRCQPVTTSSPELQTQLYLFLKTHQFYSASDDVIMENMQS